ncbi:MAG TPA: NUDIX domain-containing protein [Thermoanaerobaculia bacterium]|nr:NUDIX domain-containing protein [Thermoanaerobaculia bacterium]
MAKTRLSAGLLLYRRQGNELEVFLVHPGGPFWAKKDYGSWSIPKGEFEEPEDPLAAARREFLEETGFEPSGAFVPLKPLKQPSGKTVHAYAVEGDCDAAAIRSNSFSMEWPRGSGKTQEFPEVDRAAWFEISEAYRRILPGQAGFLDQIQERLG